jgi:hypothetical protein
MHASEFKAFMDCQISEIEKYRELRSQDGKEADSNECAFEWIRENAERFRKNWKKHLDR